MSLSGRIVSDAADAKTESSRTPQRRQISASLAQSTTLGPMRIIANPVPIMPEISSGGEAESARATGGASCDGAADGAGFADSDHPQPDGETGKPGTDGTFQEAFVQKLERCYLSAAACAQHDAAGFGHSRITDSIRRSRVTPL